MSVNERLQSVLGAEPTPVLVDWIHDTQYEDLPVTTVAATKRFILDTLGTGLAGTTMPGGRELAALVRRWGGAPEATLWGFGDRVPAPHAALVNSAVAHALDYDDTHDPSATHACVPVLPAAFAMAERVGRVDGRRFLVAAAIGIDLGVRLALAVRDSIHRGFLPTTLCGVFGGTAAAGRLLGLDRAGLRDALGLAYSQTNGNRQSLVDGALAKRIQPGFAAQAGVMAAELAAAGITGAKQPLEGIFGLSALYTNGDLNTQILVDGLGERYEVENLTCKPYPCCSSTHPAINAVLAIRERTGLRAEDVESVRIGTIPVAYDLVGRPFAIRENPQVDAQFSNAYTVAVALLQGKLTIADFAPDHVRANIAAHQLAKRVETFVNPSLSGRYGEIHADVVVRTRGGAIHREQIAFVKGSPECPLTPGEQIAKFRDCARHAQRPLSLERQREIVAYIDALEHSKDVGALIAFLA